MIAYSCNLSCRGCISLSDFPREGIAPYENIISWVNNWSNYIQPEVITIFGGEPLLHPDLIDIIQDVQGAWPNSTIRLITNGYLLDRVMPHEWFKINNFEMQISIHRKDHETLINKHIKEILKYKKDWRVHQIGGNDHRQIEWRRSGTVIYKSIFKDFVVPYRQEHDVITYWDSDPIEAHKICGAPATPILYKGKLYKCPAVANVIELTGNAYQGYTGFDVNDDLSLFVSQINKPELVCGQCPDKKQAVIIDHIDIKNVIVKQKIPN